MQRHFSSRGEALPEVTAARMLARRKQSAETASATQIGRQNKTEQWFTKSSHTVRQPKLKAAKPNQDVAPLP